MLYSRCSLRSSLGPSFALRTFLAGALPALLAGLAPPPARAQGEYTVYPLPIESPNHTTPVPPADARMLVVAPADGAASPFGWHDTDGMAGAEATTLEGNNARVFSDEMPPLPPADCGAGLQCTFPLDLTMAPVSYSQASQTQVFYWLDLFHDVSFGHGFDSAAGNFQLNPYGGGGVGGDRLEARLRYDLNCGTTVAVPPDGSSASLQLSPCTLGGITRDPALDVGAVLHLAGHPLEKRLVGGPANVGCTGNTQSPAEGWADYLPLLFTIEPGDDGADPRTLGTYFIGQTPDGPGIRSQPYSTDPAVNTMVYEDIVGAATPFDIGEVWAQALWQATWALIDTHGFDPDLADAAGGAGNQRALTYVLEGMKNTPCTPSFLDARDGIVSAALAINGGEDVCRLWEAFAEMGLGVDASSSSPNSTSVTNGFEVPGSCPPDTGPFFLDGFESGDCAAWSSASPPC